MQTSSAPRREIEHAKVAIARMRSADSLLEFDEHWKHYLHRVERTWNKTKAHFGKSPKWGNWAAKYEKERTQDPLLSYLCNARGADEHTTTEVTSQHPGGIGIGLADGVGVQPDGSIFIEKLTINTSPGKLEITSAQPLKLTFHAAQVRMEPVVNRGRHYQVPTAHAGAAIDSNDLPAVAELAITYYESAVSRAEEFFIK